MAENKAGKFELTPRQRKLVKRYFPRKDETPDEQPTEKSVEVKQAIDEKPQKRPQEKPVAKTENPVLETAQTQPAPVYVDAVCDLNRALNSMKNATTNEELESAKDSFKELVKKYTPFYEDMCMDKIRGAKYYIDAFLRRTA